MTPALSLMIKLPLHRLVHTADVIILGDVDNIRFEWSLNKEIIYTITTLRIKEVWKGNILYPEIIIQTPGGTIGDLNLKVSDTPVFQKGEEVLVFLKKIDDFSNIGNSFTVSLNYATSFSVFGGAQGKYSIDQNKMSRKSGYSLLDKEVDKDWVLPLSDLKARIKACLKNDLLKKKEKDESIKR